ncbi:MAG: hypothetical protein D6812_02855 [Deltaproteobacteria bacterium]|nr:MAG: hypothetical protein D6812_02855 [Deltaproteobacteria bacterium]
MADSTDYFVLWANTLNAVASGDGPYNILDESATNSGEARLVTNSGRHLYLEVAHLAKGTTNTFSLTTNPVITAYGKVPLGHTRYPSVAPWEVDATFHNYNTEMSSLTGQEMGLWTPLTEPNYTRGTLTQTLDGEAWRDNRNTDKYLLSEPRVLYTGGADEVLVVLNTAAAGTDFTKGMVVGRFTT